MNNNETYLAMPSKGEAHELVPVDLDCVGVVPRHRLFGAVDLAAASESDTVGAES